MRIPGIIEDLRKLNIGIKTKDGQLVLSGSKDKLSNNLFEEIKANKNELIEYIKSYDNQSTDNPTPTLSYDGYFPLTAQQKSIWIATQNPDTSFLYNQPSMFLATGKLSIDALEYSLNNIAKRHESLRTVFDEINGEPCQKVLNNVEISIDYKKLNEHEKINDIFKEFSSYVFDLTKLPLLKCMIVNKNESEHYLIFNIHHIISDGWSVNVFLKELLGNYSLYIQNGINEEELIEVNYHFREYVDKQNNYIESVKGKANIEFWKTKIGNDYSRTSLSSKSDYDGLNYNTGDYYNFYIHDDTEKEIYSFCKTKKVTPFHFYSAAFALLLSRYTGNNTISFGTPFACRNDIKYNDAIGCFINTLPVIINVKQADTYEQLLALASSEITEVYNHQNYPAENIVKNINLPQVKAGSPLFDIILVYQNYSLNKLTTDGLELSFMETPAENNRAGLVLRIFQDNKRVLINIEYGNKLFDSYFILQLSEHYKTIINNILLNPSAKISDIEYMTEHEKALLNYDLNNSDVKFPKNRTILDYLYEQFKIQKDSAAVTVKGKNLTYAELDIKSNLVANYLIKETKTGPDEIIGIMTGRNENLIIGIIAILKTGSAYLPVNPEYPSTRKTHMMDDSRCKYVLTDDLIENGHHNYISVSKILKEEKYKKEELTSKIEISQSDSAYIIYTSGSTGKPKGVLVNHKNLLRLFINAQPKFDFNEGDVWTMFHSYSFDFSVWEIFGALLFGGRLVIVPDETTKDPIAFYDLLARENVTVLNQTPSAFYRILIQENKKLALRYIIFGGEALQPKKLKDWKLCYPGTKLINMYGITETTVHVTYKEIENEDILRGISNIGKPIPTMGICLLDGNLSILPKGIPGQICVYGMGLSQGYLNHRELTAEKFRNIPTFGLCYLSGDLGRILENGDIEYLGRMDDQVQFHGFRIELSEIENALVGIEGIKESVVLVVENESEVSLTAFIVLSKDISINSIRQELGKTIPEYMIPSIFVFIDAVPITPNGKTDKKALMKLKPAKNNNVIKPANEIEENILEAWKSTLGDIDISTDESFFVIGGDSIKALKLVREINYKFNAELTIAGLYENNTIKKLAAMNLDKTRLNREIEIRKELKRIEDNSEQLIKTHDLSNSVEHIIPMSDLQRGMIYYSLKNPESFIYHDQFVYQVYVKDFSFEILCKSLELLVNKHQTLRTSFNMFAFSEDMQLIYKNIKPYLEYEDLSEKNTDEIEKVVNNYVSTERTMKFDFASAPLWRMKAFQGPNNILLIFWSFHHALFDGWSNASFVTELFYVYRNILNNPEYKPDLLIGSYLNYIAEQNVIKRNNSILDFWKEELADYKRLELPKKRWDDITSKEDEYHLPLNASLIAALKINAFDLGTDLKTIFFSAYLYSMSMLTYDDDILVGIVTNNRPIIEDSEKILGCFLNTIPFRINIDNRQTWKEFILSVNTKMNVIKKYETMSLFEIVKQIGSPIGDSNPLFDVF